MQSLENFRFNLRRLIDEREDLSQRIIAARVGTSQVHIHRILKGTVSPTLAMCDKIADAVGVPLADLVVHPEKFPVEVS